jgi:hypothetical protein
MIEAVREKENNLLIWMSEAGTGGNHDVFSTTIDTFGTALSDLSFDTKCRIILCFLASRLSGDSLRQAVVTMTDLYEWQNLVSQTSSTPKERTRFKSAGTRKVERPRISFDE